LREVKDQLRALKEPELWGSIDLNELYMTPKVTIPKKFKVSNFEKFDGSANSLIHLKSYYSKMLLWSKDDQFLVHFFPESLTSLTLLWFIQLDLNKTKRWIDVSELFMKQYKININIAPTREQLKNMKKKGSETFKEYAQRWRLIASQVQPPLIRIEVCFYFI